MVKPNAIADPFMLTGIIGFLVMGVLMFNGSINQTWGFTLGLFFGIMLISSLLSMSPELPAYVKNKKRKKL